MKLILKITSILCLLFQVHIQLTAQDESSPIMFIYDGSGSMWGQIEGVTKKEIAAEVLSTAVNNLSETQKVSLMAYGHRKKADCNDVEVIVDLNNTSKDQVIQAVNDINPLGKTPLAHSATLAINSLRDSQTKATIILVTDGIESCDGNICEVVAKAKAEGIDFKFHIVGFGLKEGETEQLKCAASAGGGQYYDAADAEGLNKVLYTATTETIDDPPGNFSIYATKNGEPVDAWIVAYKIGTKDKVAGSRTYGDSAFVYLAPGEYDIAVQPLENTDISGTTITVKAQEGETGHQTVSFDGATVSVKTTNNNEDWDAVVKMYHIPSGKVASTSRTYGKVQAMEVNPGIYDIRFDALRMKGAETTYTIENVEIKAGETKSLSHNFKSGIARIGVSSTGGELVDATIKFTEVNSGKNIDSGRSYTNENSNPQNFILSPGSYSVKVVTLGKHKGNSDTFTIIVNAGVTTEKLLTF